MKIDEACIDHNALRLIEKELACIWDGAADDAVKEYALMTNAKIQGIVDMANELKEVLKA